MYCKFFCLIVEKDTLDIWANGQKLEAMVSPNLFIIDSLLFET